MEESVLIDVKLIVDFCILTKWK